MTPTRVIGFLNASFYLNAIPPDRPCLIATSPLFDRNDAKPELRVLPSVFPKEIAKIFLTALGLWIK